MYISGGMYYLLFTDPIPHEEQHESKSSAEIWGVSLPPDAMQILSVIASTAPNAWYNVMHNV